MTRSTIGWKPALLDILKENFGNQKSFTLQQVYQVAHQKMSEYYPENNNIGHAIRATLQSLRDSDIINFEDNDGNYSWQWCPETAKKPTEGYIYIIENVVFNEGIGSIAGYKIGKTTRPDSRFRQLCVGTKARLVAYYRSVDYTSIEKALHKRYDKYRVPQSEWFMLPETSLLDLLEVLDNEENCEGLYLETGPATKTESFQKKASDWIKRWLPTFSRPFRPMLAN